MKYLIKIDRKSVKKNPNAGNQDYLVHSGPTTNTLTINGGNQKIVDYLENNFGMHLVSSEVSTHKGSQSEFYLLGFESDHEKIFSYLKKNGIDPEDIQITTTFHHQHVHSMTPEPEYFYKYKDTKVKCCYCKAKFSYTKLKDEDNSDWDNWHCGRSNICPHCDKENCCEIEFEKFGGGTTVFAP